MPGRETGPEMLAIVIVSRIRAPGADSGLRSHESDFDFLEEEMGLPFHVYSHN